MILQLLVQYSTPGDASAGPPHGCPLDGHSFFISFCQSFFLIDRFFTKELCSSQAASIFGFCCPDKVTSRAGIRCMMRFFLCTERNPRIDVIWGFMMLLSSMSMGRDLTAWRITWTSPQRWGSRTRDLSRGWWPGRCWRAARDTSLDSWGLVEVLHHRPSTYQCSAIHDMVSFFS